MASAPLSFHESPSQTKRANCEVVSVVLQELESLEALLCDLLPSLHVLNLRLMPHLSFYRTTLSRNFIE